jgi:fatty-acyl-CoA synthase
VEYRAACTVGDLLVRGATRHPDRDVVVLPGERRTYAQLLDRAVGVARWLHGLGVRRGDRVGILMPNSLDYVETWFGIVLLGAVVVPINGRFRSVELRHVVPHSGIRALVVADEPGVVSYVDRLVQAFPALADQGAVAPGSRVSIPAAPNLRHVVDLAADPGPGMLGPADVAAILQEVPREVVHQAAARVCLRDEATVFYTSGTTALPKGCVLTHEAMSRQGQDTAARLDMWVGDVVLSPLPMFHTGHTQFFYAVLDRVGTYVTMRAFDADAGLALLRDEGVTVMVTAFPAITDGLAYHPDATAGDFSRVRTLFTIAQPSQLRELEDRLQGPRLVTGFGMTEFAGSLAISNPHDPQDERVVPGRPLRGAQVEIRDVATGQPVPPGVEGQIVALAPTRFEAYHDNPEATRDALGDDGWYRTGDMGVIDERGLLQFRDRIKDMLKVGGENVAALEIESHLMTHPDVVMAAVVGVPDDRFGEVPVAFVEVAPGAALSEDDVVAHCRGQIASFKVPRQVRFVDEWPMSATKIRKVELRAMLQHTGS